MTVTLVTCEAVAVAPGGSGGSGGVDIGCDEANSDKGGGCGCQWVMEVVKVAWYSRSVVVVVMIMVVMAWVIVKTNFNNMVRYVRDLFSKPALFLTFSFIHFFLCLLLSLLPYFSTLSILCYTS